MGRQEVANSGVEREQMKVAALVVVTLLTLYLLYRILEPFSPAIVWGIALAIVAQPLHRRLRSRLRRDNIAAAVSVLLVAAILVVPAVIVTQQVILQGTKAVRVLRSPQAREQWTQALERHPRLAPAARWLQERINIQIQAQGAAGAAASAMPAVFSISAKTATQILISLFTLFFLLRDREYFLGAMRSFVPLSNRETDEIFQRIQETIDAAVRGRVFIALIQGALGGLMFWVLGLPGPLLWGTAMALLATIPMLGPFVIWVPATILLVVLGHPVKALILALWGALVVSTIDNVLYPILVGKNLQYHTLIIFFAVLGGVAAFGVSGLVIGPVIVAVADALMEIWDRRTRRRGVSTPELRAA